eukprot:scaffold44001_cov37-Cyclotella_meneghiniana.AAC.1
MEISANASTYQHGAARGEKCSHRTNAKHEHIQLNQICGVEDTEKISWPSKDLSLRRRMR